MIKILQIGMSSNYGGIEVFLFNYYEEINKTKFQFDFIDIYGEGIAFQEQIRQLGGKVYLLPNYKHHPIAMMKKLMEIERDNQYDIIHINVLSAANLLPVIVSYFAKKTKIIIHSHSSAIPKGMLRFIVNMLGIYIIRKMNVAKWACGLNAGKWMWGNSFCEEDIIPNAIDMKRFEKDELIRNSLRSRCGFTNEDFVVGFIGSFTEAKNVFFLANIIFELQKRTDKYKLLMIGEGPLRVLFIDYCKKIDVINSVTMVGVQSKAYEWYQAMDCFVLPSRFEGVPLVGIEAQAAKLPTFISSNVTREIALTNYIEYLPISDAGVWAEAIHNLVPIVNEKFSSLKKFDIQYTVRKLEQKYEEYERE